MAKMVKYFPEGIALGDAFVNRKKEREHLINRIKANKHTVLMAPRRYGKTSLVMKVAQEMDMPYASIDLLAAYSAEYVRDQIVDKAGLLAINLSPSLHKAKEKLFTIFRQMKPEIAIGAFGQKLTMSLSASPLHDITEILLKLDETAKYFQKRAVIFLDEFQQISQLKHFNSIEASIRHAVERSEYISYVFSGSNRQLLQQMFGEYGRPLYRLCQTINLERMQEQHYYAYLQDLSAKRWLAKLPAPVIEQIFRHTELHTFYMNVLCQLLWETDQIPDLEKVDFIWHNYVKTQRQIISHDVMGLSPNQRKVLTALAKEPAKEIQSSDFTAPIKISASSSQQAIEVLLHKDLVYKREDDYYCVLDPAMRYYLDVVLWE